MIFDTDFAAVGEWANSKFALITQAGYKVDLEINNSTFVITPKLYDKNNNLISTGTGVDLPLESVVVNGSYDNTNQKIILTLKNGNTVDIPVSGLVSGLYSKPSDGIPRTDLASDIRNGSTPFIVGTQTGTTATWTGNAPTITSLYSGLTIKYYLSQTSASGTTLNLTLANGTKTGALRIYLKGSTRVTTHFAKGSVIFLTYLASADNNVGRNAWFVTSPPYYPDGDNYNTRYNFTLTAGDTSASSSIRVFTSKSTTFYTLAKGLSFRVDMPILYAPALETDETSSSSYLVYYTANLTGNDANLADLTAGLPVYVKGTISGNIFTADSTDLFTQTEPSSADGKAYIYLGVARSLTNIFLESEHPIYRYIDGAFQNADTLFASISDGDSGAY